MSGPAHNRIVEVAVHEVVVPARRGAIDSESIADAHAYGRWDLQPITLLEARDSSGLVGLGEVGRGWTIAALEPWLRRLPGLTVCGTAIHPSDLPPEWLPRGEHGGMLLEPHPPAPWSGPCPLWPALEVALLDLAGKRLGCRAVDLLGGVVRDRVAVDYWAGRQTPADLQRTVARARERGFRGIKTKSRLGDPTLAQARAVRDAGGEGFELTVDAMFQWLAPRHALGTLRGLEAFGDGVRVEDPFPQDRPEHWRRARDAAAVPLVWHARTLAVLRRAMQEGCFDALNVGGGGSVREFLAFAAAAGALGHDVWHGSALELGVMQAARLHACAAAPACVLPSDLQGAIVRERHLTDWAWPYAGGYLPLPDGPGLGVNLDQHALRHYLKAQATFGRA